MYGGLGDRIRLQYIPFLPLFQRIALKGIVPVNAFSLLMFALRMLRRDARAGELRLLAAALLLPVGVWPHAISGSNISGAKVFQIRFFVITCFLEFIRLVLFDFQAA